MSCAICNKVKNWRDGFPGSIYAECWECAWEAHVRTEHKPTWIQRRALKKKLASQLQAELEQEELKERASDLIHKPLVGFLVAPVVINDDLGLGTVIN